VLRLKKVGLKKIKKERDVFLFYLRLRRVIAATATIMMTMTAAAMTYASVAGKPAGGDGAIVGDVTGEGVGAIVGVGVGAVVGGTVGVGEAVTTGAAAATTPTAVWADDGPYDCVPAKFAVMTYSPVAGGVHR